jgi:solute carrier family 25 (mitochondrial S-adenosylmethionine transporter), member 26
MKDESTARRGKIITNISPSRATSRSAFLAILLLTVPMSSAESVETRAMSNATEVETISQSRSLARKSSSTKEETISGFVAGAALTLTKTIVKYPMDTATVRLQMPNTKYTIRQPLQLLDDAYVGIAAPLLANVPAGAVFFAVKDAVQASLKSVARSATAVEAITSLCSNRVFRTCLAVAVAQIPYWIVRNPSEVVKTRQQSGLYTQEEKDPALLQSISSTNESNATTFENRWAGWYTGFWENVLYAYPADVLKFVCYEQLSFLFGLDQSELNPAESALYGAIATASAQWITTPLDVVRNRVMARSGAKAISDSTLDLDVLNNENTTTFSSFLISYTKSLWRLARNEGLEGLFAGATPRVIKAFISGAIQFSTYEETKQAIAAIFSNIGRP